MWLRNSFCHVFGSERAISVLARLSATQLCCQLQGLVQREFQSYYCMLGREPLFHVGVRQ